MDMPPTPPPQHGSHGFTLIELLVVITVIVILLALLAPALDRAVYAAEMAVCIGNERAAVQGGLAYTGDYKRRYFYRAHVVSSAVAGTSYGIINMNLTSTEPNWDDRVIFRGYIPVNKALNCPLNAKLDYEGSTTGPGAANPNTFCYSDYAMFMGAAYAGGRGMFKLGDRIACTVAGEWVTSNVLVGSFAQRNATDAFYAEHPDNNGLWVAKAAQDAGDDWNATPLYTITWSRFDPLGHPYVFNMNFAMDDNSVQRINDITPESDQDDGVKWISAWTDPAKGLVTPIPAN